ncbi:NADH-ubiquinone oxidoreductase-F iron-sulfur binding region domain-containing protein [Candidatus Poriferisocius sp.]|uniref:NADH-ubiquinone oxidoreductase-F iron-sulfur binding region domain-containing protein n=1 Tax=Candidatus Poriferisocius sp. TaxID=3101276 RepID=UPI003B5CDEE0
MADLHFGTEQPTAAEQAAIDAVVAPDDAATVSESERLARGGRARRHARRHLLLPMLHALQHRIGWISPGGLNGAAERLGVPPAEAYGVATFYEMFRTTDPGHRDDVVHVCVDPACALAGADDLQASLAGGGARVHPSPCLGQCDRAPARFIQGVDRPDRVPADDDEVFRLPQAGEPGLRVLGRVGEVDPTSLDSYRAHRGYRALQRAVEKGPDAVIEAIRAAGLSGRGGAAFPTGVKWRAVADELGPDKHVVANCDESEPGTFKDRILCEHDPFALIESMTIAGLATGAPHGWIYIRGEYPRATARLEGAIAAARAAGLLGDDVAGSGLRFDIELRRGAGAYICGEETALFNSIEGFRGEPRNKPPFPTTHGLFGQPTAINNPETLVNVLDIVNDGPEAYRSVGTEQSPGTRLFCLSGRVGAPGLYEVPFGTTLGELLDRAGGPVGRLAAVLLGGAAGVFVGPESLDLRLTLEDARAAGATLGSGVVTVFDDTADMEAVVVRIAEFFRDESCGQCVPCRVGTQRQYEVLVELQATGGSMRPKRADLVHDMARAMADASICGLGHTAASAVRSALALGLIGQGDGNT